MGLFVLLDRGRTEYAGSLVDVKSCSWQFPSQNLFLFLADFEPFFLASSEQFEIVYEQ